MLMRRSWTLSPLDGRRLGYAAAGVIGGNVAQNVDTVRAMFDAYLAQDRDAVARLLADGFHFTSPQDDHIDKADFLERCFPTTDRLAWQSLRYVVPVDEDNVFVMYDYQLKTGERHRNAELLTVRSGRITETQVFFGGPVAADGDAHGRPS